MQTAWAQQALPKWLQGAPIGGWVQIPNTAIASVRPNPLPPQPGGGYPEGKIRAWNGMALDPRTCTFWSAANGGHNDYSGNEADAITLTNDAPTWVQRAAPSMNVGQDVPYYPDGRPASRHSYYAPVFSTIRNRYLIPGGTMYGGIGPTFPKMDGFNVVTNTWDPAGTYPDLPFIYGAGALTAVMDSTTEDIYYLSEFHLMKWTQATNTWSTISTNWDQSAASIYTAGAWDSMRKRVVFFTAANSSQRQIVIYTPSTGTKTIMQYSGPDAGAPNSSAGDGFAYVPVLDAFLVQKGQGGGTVYRINASTFSVSTFGTTGGSGIPSTASDGTQGVYKRWQYCPQLGGVVYCATYDSNLWFLRTNSSGDSLAPDSPTNVEMR